MIDKLTFDFLQKHVPALSYDELAAVRKNLQRSGINVENDYVRDTWHVIFRRHFLNRSLARAYDCRKGFYLYNQGLETEVNLSFFPILKKNPLILSILTCFIF